MMVVGSIGTTLSGSIDDLHKIGRVAEKYNMWFHIDGAMGGVCLLSYTLQHLKNGMLIWCRSICDRLFQE